METQRFTPFQRLKRESLYKLKFYYNRLKNKVSSMAICLSRQEHVDVTFIYQLSFTFHHWNNESTAEIFTAC